ncbi:MAG TPA: hypothetical protein VFK68_04620, partial [Propionibacteriaceae bacterium]|nr:hypothetical protein [Propionibacteriaceae bacterium]
MSSVDGAAGEVYLRELDPAADGAVRVTCNTQVESHPVLSPDGRMIAYASRQPSGAWQIWVVWLRVDDSSEALLPCAQMPRVQITTRGSNTWPTWLGNDRIAFSSSRTDPLGDLYAVRLGGRAAPVDDAEAAQLTFSSAAETQPAAVVSGNFQLLVFTTTEFRRDGSLAGIRVDEDQSGTLTPGVVTSLWPGAPPQSTEAAFDTDAPRALADGGLTARLRLGFTTTEVDPFGDVMATVLASRAPPTAGTDGTTTSRPGVLLSAADPTIVFGFRVVSGATQPISAEPGR